MDKHLSSQFDAELTQLCSRVLEMGGLVEAQIHHAVQALSTQNAVHAQEVLDTEAQVNRHEIEIDREVTSTIARRQPAARDLRLLMAITKISANLERAGDEAEKIARMVHKILAADPAATRPSKLLRVPSDLASALLRKSLNAFARLDVTSAYAILKEDDAIDAEFDGFVRTLVTHMMEDPRTISSSLDLLFVAKAIERIGDHAKNIAESTIYIVQGADVRHSSRASAHPSSP